MSMKMDSNDDVCKSPSQVRTANEYRLDSSSQTNI